MAVDKYELADIMRAMAEGLASSGELSRARVESKQMQAVAMKFIKLFTTAFISRRMSINLSEPSASDVIEYAAHLEQLLSKSVEEFGGSLSCFSDNIDEISKEIFKQFTGFDYKEES